MGQVAPGAPPVAQSVGGEAPPSLTGLRPGDLVEVEILEPSGRGEGRLRLGGQVLRGLFPENLARGARLTLRLMCLGPPMELHLPGKRDGSLPQLLHTPSVGLATAIRSFLGSRLPQIQDGSTEAALLSAARRLLALPHDPEGLARALARWVQGSGLFHEARLAQGEDPADLKSLALKLLARFPEGDLARSAKALLGHVEAHQARSLLEGEQVVPLVLPWDEEWIQGELRVTDERQGDSWNQRASRRIRMRLHMPHLGPVEVSLWWGTGAVSVRLSFSPRILEIARTRLDELARALADAPGLAVADLRVDALSAPEPRTGSGLVEVLA